MEQMALGVLASLIAATAFLLFLSKLRPKFKISKEIAVFPKGKDNEYYIKILNKGPRDAINIKVEVDLMTSKNVPEGAILTHSPIALKKDDRMVLSKYNKKDKEATFAYRITIVSDLDKLWSDEANQFVRIKIFAQDEMSNFGRVFVQEYRTKRYSIKKGEFHFGDTLEIS